MPENKVPTSVQPILGESRIGYEVEEQYDDEGNQISPSTLANERAEEDKGYNPDFFASSGKTREEQNEIGKGANPSADIVTKNVTTIDPVFREPTPVADNRTIPATVPASLPMDAPVTRASGRVDYIGQEPTAEEEKDYTEGVLVREQRNPGAGRDGKLEEGDIKVQSKVVYGAEAEQATKTNEELATGVKAGEEAAPVVQAKAPAVKAPAPTPAAAVKATPMAGESAPAKEGLKSEVKADMKADLKTTEPKK